MSNIKQQQIITMFDDISKRYDTANRILSMGIDVSWRKKACEMTLKALQQNHLHIVDVATGTGDMIIHWQNAMRNANLHIKRICGIDPSRGMLDVAKTKLPHTEFLQAEAIQLPLENESVDVLSIAYGLRNVVDTNAAFAEFARVIKQGGMLVILEFTKNQNPNFLASVMGFYTNKILPKLGGLISRNPKAYQYLPDSINNFFTTDELQQQLHHHGFERIHVECAAHVSTLYIGKNIRRVDAYQ